MKLIQLDGGGIAVGEGALAHLATVRCRKCMVVTGGSSMEKTGVLAKVCDYLERDGQSVYVHSGVRANPTTQQIEAGVMAMRRELPDLIVAVGGGSVIDAAKIMTLFYEFPALTFANVDKVDLPAKRERIGLVAIPSTSGTGSEVTAAAVYTDTQRRIKVPVKTTAIRPDLAILDPSLPMTMPKHIAAETGMDALTHALESYLNHGMDGFTEVYCRGAIQDLLKWLPESCNAPSPRAREKVHYCQCMAGMSFANVGLGMVHGIAHSFGGIYDIAHGLANAVILPYALQYNSRDPRVREKLARLGDCTGGGDLIGRIIDLKEKLGIPGSFRDIIGVREFQTNFKPLVDYALETGTRANPVPMTRPEMERVVGAVYYGKEIDW